MTDLAPDSVRIVATAAQGEGLSGSDRIFIELARRWARNGRPVRISVSREGRAMCLRNGLSAGLIEMWPLGDRPGGRARSYFHATLSALRHARAQSETTSWVYSASDFWPDVLPALYLRWRTGARWIAGFYMFAPAPWRGFEGDFRPGPPRLEDVFYWLSQRLSLPLIKRFADVILVTNSLDKQRLVHHGLELVGVVVVRGGIDVALAEAVAVSDGPSLDAVFIGRLHVQKGVPQLLDIWRQVIRKLPAAQLAIIGDGPLENELRAQIERDGLQKNVSLLGFKDGVEKYEIVKRSQLVLHPALYDSGGMAACEAMICGVPGVAFDLPALREYYPRGMVKVAPYDLDEFARVTVELLEDDERRRALGAEARDYAKDWDWEFTVLRVTTGIDRALRRKP